MVCTYVPFGSLLLVTAAGRVGRVGGRVGGSVCIPQTPLAVPVGVGVVVHFIIVDVFDTGRSVEGSCGFWQSRFCLASGTPVVPLL